MSEANGVGQFKIEPFKRPVRVFREKRSTTPTKLKTDTHRAFIGLSGENMALDPLELIVKQAQLADVQGKIEPDTLDILHSMPLDECNTWHKWKYQFDLGFDGYGYIRQWIHLKGEIAKMTYARTISIFFDESEARQDLLNRLLWLAEEEGISPSELIMSVLEARLFLNRCNKCNRFLHKNRFSERTPNICNVCSKEYRSVKNDEHIK